MIIFNLYITYILKSVSFAAVWFTKEDLNTISLECIRCMYWHFGLVWFQEITTFFKSELDFQSIASISATKFTNVDQEFIYFII